MRKSKWTYEVIIGAVLIVVGLSVWWFVNTAPQRKAAAEVETMIKYAQRQALEIVIIEQSSKLADYRRQLAVARKSKTSVMLPFMPSPIIPDPKDVEVK